MNPPILRVLIQERLAAGHLPHDDVRSVWGRPGHGETCDGCGEGVTTLQTVMEGVGESGREVRFHVPCFYLWTVERQRPRREPRRLD